MKQYIHLGLICSLLWCVLDEQISVNSVLLGFVLGIASIAISKRMINTSIQSPKGRLGLINSLNYLLVLFINIYKSGFLAIRSIITGQVNVGFVKLKTNLKSPLYRAILSNSITLTPGTVTVELDDDVITVLWLHKKCKDMDIAEEVIKGSFERILIKGEKND